MLKKKEFLEKYDIEEAFENSDLKWEELSDIYDDYSSKLENYNIICSRLEKYILDGLDFPIESIKCRYKDPEHLIEKIIRKRGIEQSYKYVGINKDNYSEIVRDLIGVRILVLAKEEWENVFKWLNKKFDRINGYEMAEPPQAYTRYGDRDIFKNKIKKEHTNKGYRSQHYIICFENSYAEIQVRTLAEEVHGEFDHRVKYPYRIDNNFLNRYTRTVAQLVDSIDELISTCFQMGEEGWESNAKFYDEDQYVDWKHVSEKRSTGDKQNKEQFDIHTEEVDVKKIANDILKKG